MKKIWMVLLWSMTVFASSNEFSFIPEQEGKKYPKREADCKLDEVTSKFDWAAYEEIGQIVVKNLGSVGLDRKEFFKEAREIVCRVGGHVLLLEGWWDTPRKGIVFRKKTP